MYKTSKNKELDNIYSKNNVVVKEEVDTDSSLGYKPNERPMKKHLEYGIINVDKPPGPTSHQVVDWIKKILDYKKAGHGGTLDPEVSGVLPIAGEEVTKVMGSLLHGSKEYVASMYLHDEVEEKNIREILKEFEGEIYQKPPQRSAVKRRLRTRKINEIEYLDKKGRDLLIRISCESGTYIRKLCQHIGYLLGTGAHMDELRRTRTGIFDERSSLTLHDLIDYYKFWKNGGEERYLREAVFPVEKVVEDLNKIWIKDSAVSAIAHGADLAIPGISALTEGLSVEDQVAVLSMKGELVGIGDAVNNTDHILENDKGIAVKINKVIIPRDLYPKMW